MKKQIFGSITGIVILAVLFAGCGSSTGNSSSPTQMHFVNIVKLTGVAWFNRMDVGLQTFSKQSGIKADQVGPTQATAEGQIALVQELIPQKPTVIGIDPNNQQAVEGVLGQAKSAGIIVVSQEAPYLNNTNFDLEAFSNASYGSSMMDTLAQCMGGQGQYAFMVGSLTASSHMQWAQAAQSEAQQKYPGITRVTAPVESNEDANVAYQKTKALLAKYPNIKGFIGSAATDVIGIARAVTEMGLAGKVCIAGTSLPSLAGSYIKSGTIYKIFLWDPAMAGQATMNAAQLLAQGKQVKAGTNLHVPGYTNIQPCGNGMTSHCFVGNAELQIGKDNLSSYSF
ncbi:autoinducer 2 ABC transporter substrate-binding protein [Ktedonobacteria bacterium brp13]|nr:autoinducer 2 ABC transporter substrate-binding protein [Ktedonobacteria bacterium brp13]